jgi:hypothetical protein
MTRIPRLLTFLELLGVWDHIPRWEGKVLPDINCPFCQHKSHADKGCKSCSCKTGEVGN